MACPAGATCSGAAVLARMYETAPGVTPLLSAPRRSRAVENGTNAMSSWSRPVPDSPLRASTPVTCMGVLRTRISRPIGSEAPNRRSATVAPRTTTLPAPNSSRAEKGRPAASGQSRMAK